MMMKAVLLLMALSMPMPSSQNACVSHLEEVAGQFCGSGSAADICKASKHTLWTLEDKDCQCEFSKKTLLDKREGKRHDGCADCDDVKKFKNNKGCSCHKLGCKCPKHKNRCFIDGPIFYPAQNGYSDGSESSSGSGGYYAYDPNSYGGYEGMVKEYGYGGYDPDYHYQYEGYGSGEYGYSDGGACKWEHIKDYYYMGNKDDICPEEKIAIEERNKYKADYDVANVKYTNLKAEYGKLKEKLYKYESMANDDVNEEEDAGDIQTAAASASTGAIMAILLPMAYWFS